LPWGAVGLLLSVVLPRGVVGRFLVLTVLPVRLLAPVRAAVLAGAVLRLKVFVVFRQVGDGQAPLPVGVVPASGDAAAAEQEQPAQDHQREEARRTRLSRCGWVVVQAATFGLPRNGLQRRSLASRRGLPRGRGAAGRPRLRGGVWRGRFRPGR